MLQLLLLKLLPASPPSSCCCSSIKRLMATVFWYKYFNTIKYYSIKLSHVYWQLCCCCFLVGCSIKILSVMFRYKTHAAKNSLVATLCFLEFNTLHLWTRPLLLHLLAHFLLLLSVGVDRVFLSLSDQTRWSSRVFHPSHYCGFIMAHSIVLPLLSFIWVLKYGWSTPKFKYQWQRDHQLDK